MSNKKVFIIQIPCKDGKLMDVSKAESFGKIQEPCFTSKTDVTKENETIDETLQVYFEKGNISNDDYILQVGEHTLFTKGCLIASQYADVINILKWDRKIINGRRTGGDYCCITTSLPFDD